MKTFKDTEGREWPVAINVAAIRRVKDLLGVDLLDLTDDRFAAISTLIGKPVELVNVIYVLCKPKADERNITDEQFGEAMAGDAIQHAADAFLDEYANFFPDPRMRAGLKKLMDASRKVQGHLLDHAESVLEKIDPAKEAKELIAKAEAKNTNGSSGSARESSVLTPDPVPGESST